MYGEHRRRRSRAAQQVKSPYRAQGPLCPWCLRVSRLLKPVSPSASRMTSATSLQSCPSVWFSVPERFRVITPSAAAQLRQRSPTRRESTGILADRGVPWFGFTSASASDQSRLLAGIAKHLLLKMPVKWRVSFSGFHQSRTRGPAYNAPAIAHLESRGTVANPVSAYATSFLSAFSLHS